MDIEQKQAELIQYFVKQAENLKGVSLANLIVEATSHSSLFAFSEILSVPNVSELQGTEYSVFLEVLRLFAHGTWSDYRSFFLNPRFQYEEGFVYSDNIRSGVTKVIERLAPNVTFAIEATREIAQFRGKIGRFGDLTAQTAVGIMNPGNAGCFPPLVPDQVCKLKQLSVLTLAETNKVLPYDQLMQELDVSHVRELEDFLINECMNAGIVRGKLDQLRRCFEVQFAAGRDLRPTQLASMINTLTTWLTTSDNLLLSIQEKIRWADTMSETDRKHRKEVEDRVEEVKKTIKQADMELRGHEEIPYSEPGGVMDYEEDRVRSKRRRPPLS